MTSTTTCISSLRSHGLNFLLDLLAGQAVTASSGGPLLHREHGFHGTGTADGSKSLFEGFFRDREQNTDWLAILCNDNFLLRRRERLAFQFLNGHELHARKVGG